MNSRFSGRLTVVGLVFAPALAVSYCDTTPREARGDAAEVVAAIVGTPPNRNRERDLAYFLSLPIDARQRTEGVAAAREAQALATAGQHTEALARFDRAIEVMPNLGDWLDLFAAAAS